MSTTTLPLSIGVTELTLADGSVTELVMSSVIDNKPYYDLAFAAAKVYTDAQDAAYLVTTQNEFTAADAVVLSSANTYTDTSSSNAITTTETFATAGDTAAKAFAIKRANHTGTQSVSTITGLAAVATSGLKADVGLSNVYNLAPIDMPVSTAQATANTATLNSAKSYSDSGDTTTLTSAKAYADSLVAGLFDFRGDYNASGNTYPTSSNNGSGSAGAVLKADVWRISVQGTLQGKTASVGDLLTAVVDNPAQTDANWTLTSNELAYTPENTANKTTDLSSNDSTHYPTTAAVQTAINTREPSITASVVTSFWSGTKTFRDLATDVCVVVLTGLSTATGTAITAADTILSALGKLQNQASTNATAITGKEPTITATTSADYYRGDKTFVSFATTVRTTVLTGLSTATGTVITAADTVLSALGSLQNQVSANTANAANFLVSRWQFFDLTGTATGGYVPPQAFNAGTGSYGAGIDLVSQGTNGVFRISSSATLNSGYGVYTSNIGILGQQGLIGRSISRLVASQTNRLIFDGFHNAITAVTPTNGVYFAINNLTITANAITGGGTLTTLGSYTSTAGTWLVRDIEYVSSTSARFVVWDLQTGTKYFDQTITTNVPNLAANLMASSFVAFNNGTSAVALVDFDYIGFDIVRPPFIITP